VFFFAENPQNQPGAKVLKSPDKKSECGAPGEVSKIGHHQIRKNITSNQHLYVRSESQGSLGNKVRRCRILKQTVIARRHDPRSLAQYVLQMPDDGITI